MGEELGIDYPIKARHYSEILAEQIKAGKFRFPKAEKPLPSLHDPATSAALGGYEPPARRYPSHPQREARGDEPQREQATACASCHAAQGAAGGSDIAR